VNITFVTESFTLIAGVFSSPFWNILYRLCTPVVVSSEIPLIPVPQKMRDNILRLSTQYFGQQHQRTHISAVAQRKPHKIIYCFLSNCFELCLHCFDTVGRKL